MNFYIVFTKNRKKFDKYAKVNRVRNKLVIDIKKILEDECIDAEKHKDLFNLLVFSKILQGNKKNRDIYYLPNFTDSFEFKEIVKIKKALEKYNFIFNILIFYDEFKKDKYLNDAMSNIGIFSASQIIKDY